MKRIQPADDASDWDARAAEALEIARLMPPEKAAAPKKGDAAAIGGLFLAKRSRPLK